jgi:hypothetical protein
MPTVQIKRGLRANIPATAANGELILTTDDQQLSVGNVAGTAVIPIKIAAANVTGLVNGGTEVINAQSGTSYTVVSGDAGKLITLSNASAVAVTVPAGVFTSGQYADFQNKGAGDVTITTTSATINGAATFVLHTNQGIRVVFDGTNFQVVLGRAVVAKSAVGSQWLNSVGADGVFTSSQPAFTDVSGTATAGQIPNLDASKITTGQLALARGGTNADLSATGGASQVLKQTSVGGAVTVAQLAFTDISGTLGTAQLPATIDGGTF